MKKILIVDDDPGISKALHRLFHNAGYEVALEADGSNILSGNFNMPDIILLDKYLSGTDGMDICRHLREQPATSRIPIVMISAAPGAKVEAKLAGADDFLEKPFDVRHILKMIQFYSKYSGKAGHN